MEKRLTITAKDVERAEQLRQDESVNPLTRSEMFRRIIYCILSAREFFDKQEKVYFAIIGSGFDNPGSFASDPDVARDMLYLSGADKTERVLQFAEWWPGTDIAERIMDDIAGQKDQEFQLRAEFSEECPGMGYKCSSMFLRMCGYENVVPIDLWAERTLALHGYAIQKVVKHVPSPKDQMSLALDDLPRINGRKGGLRGKQYLEYERMFTEIAKEYGYSPAMLQMIVYAKFSTWSRPKGVQLGLDI